MFCHIKIKGAKHKRKLGAWILVAIYFPKPEVQRNEMLLIGRYLYECINYAKRSTVTSLSCNKSPMNTLNSFQTSLGSLKQQF